MRNQAGDFISYWLNIAPHAVAKKRDHKCSNLKAAQECVFSIPGEPAPKNGRTPPHHHHLPAEPAVSDVGRRASGESWEQTPGTLTRQQTLNTSLLIQFHLYSQTIWQLLPTEVVTFHYGSFFFNVASCLFTVPPLLTFSAAATRKRKGRGRKRRRRKVIAQLMRSCPVI